jgi:hypothetical protein
LDLHAKNKAIPHVSNFSTLLEPNYTILTFLMIKTFFYIEFIGILSLIRIFVSRGPSRWAAFAALSIAPQHMSRRLLD